MEMQDQATRNDMMYDEVHEIENTREEGTYRGPVTRSRAKKAQRGKTVLGFMWVPIFLVHIVLIRHNFITDQRQRYQMTGLILQSSMYNFLIWRYRCSLAGSEQMSIDFSVPILAYVFTVILGAELRAHLYSGISSLFTIWQLQKYK